MTVDLDINTLCIARFALRSAMYQEQRELRALDFPEHPDDWDREDYLTTRYQEQFAAYEDINRAMEKGFAP
jgi:hypothetical protein